jgi:membrane-associated phospholipid phosphatase
LAYFLPWGPYIAVYQLTNRFPLREPIELPFTVLDSILPFVPQLLPLYVAYIPLFLWTVARAADDREVSRLFYATHLQLLLSVPFFLAMPVRMPRELFYGAEVFGWVDAFWRWFDAPNNCFPSLHTSNSLLFITVNWRRRGRIAATLLGAGVIGSTVLVKQHYVVDVLGGAAVFLVSRWLLARVEVR